MAVQRRGLTVVDRSIIELRRRDGWSIRLIARDALRPGDGIRFDFYFDGSFNNGKHDANLPDRKDLGGNMLFRVGAELGYQFQTNWSVSLFLDHDSNGGLATRNQGLNSVGLRLGYAL